MSFLPGLPALPVGVDIFDQAVQLFADAVSLFFGQGPEWGIFLDGQSVITADNVLTVSYRQDWRLSTHPQEEGAFATYNKVATPFEAKVRFSTGGTASDRQAFIDSIAAIAGDLNLYDVVTPEAVYASCNVVHYSYDRKAETAGIIAVDVWLEEVRVVGATSFSNTQSPGAAGQTQGGLAQAQPADQLAAGETPL